MPSKEEIEMITCVQKTSESLPLPLQLDIDLMVKYLKGRHFWYSLKKMFTNYFNGKPIFNKVDGMETETSKKLIELVFDHYLSLYKVVNYGWEDISKGLQYLDTEINTPGEALIYIMKGDSLIWLENNDANPRTLYYAWLEYTLCQGKSSSAKLNDYIRRIKKQTNVDPNTYQLSEHVVFRDMCVDLASMSRSIIAKTAAKDFHRDKKKLLEFLGCKLRTLW